MVLPRNCFITQKPIEKGQRRCLILSTEGYELLEETEKQRIARFRWLAFLIFPYIQAVIYYASKHREPTEIHTSIGETEFDNYSKRHNLIEGIFIEALIMFSIWFLIYYLGMVNQLVVFEYLGYALLGLGGLYVLFISHYLHRDSWHGIGLSKPLEIKELLSNYDANKKRQLIILLVILGVVFNFLFLPNWSLILIRFGMRGRDPEGYAFLTTTAGGTVVAVIVGIIVYIALALFLIRWDNFVSTFKSMLPFIVIFCLGIVITGVIYAAVGNDWTKFENFKWISSDSDSFITHSSFYTMWGMVQQYLFLSYFNTRFRKGFSNTKTGQIGCAICTGLCFGLIHMPELPLSTLTFIGGFMYSYFFGKDSSRNLFIMGIAHGIGGTLVGMLTPMVMVVGPWGV